MGVIDDDRSAALVPGDELQAAGNTGQTGEGGGGGSHRAARRDHQPQRREGVHRLELAGERQQQLAPAAENIQNQELTVGARLAGNQPQIGRGIGAIADHRMTAIAAELLEPRELGAVPIEDRGAARHQKGSEEAVLGGAVSAMSPW